MAMVIAFAIVSVLLLCFEYLIYPAFLSPLSMIPSAHPTSTISNLWIRWQRYRNNANHATHLAHQRLGPIVRLGVDEVSVNDIGAVRIIYGGDWDRDLRYRVFENFGRGNMFSMARKKEHTERKRMLGSVYSKSTLCSSQDFQTVTETVISELLASLDHAVEQGEVVEVLELLSAVSRDLICAYIFGLDDSPAEASRTWVQTRSKVSSDNEILARAKRKVKDVCLQSVDKLGSCTGSRQNMETKPVVYQQLLHHLAPATEKGSAINLTESLRLIIASELMDHMLAGTESTSWSLTYILYEMSLRPEMQSKLRGMLLAISSWSTIVVDQSLLRELDTLPLLNAIVLESLRLHPAVPGSQHRISPVGTMELCRYKIPPSTNVGAQAYSLHRNPAVFPSPEEWRPQRWLEAGPAHREEMMKWFWGFGSGARGCIGKDFAMLELKLLVAAFYANFRTSIVDDEGIEQEDGYSTGPKSNKLVLRFENVEARDVESR